MDLQAYILDTYNNDAYWFTEEVQKGHHLMRISNVINHKQYLSGWHKILLREDAKFKGKEYKTSKMILQTAKTILQFHVNYLIGKRLSLIGSENMVKTYNQVFRQSRFHSLNYKIVDKVVKYGDCYEYIYIENGKIKSKIIDPADGYPVYDDYNRYVGFIEYYVIDGISHYTVFYPDKVQKWTDRDGILNLTEEYLNVSGLPIHYQNGDNESDELFGRSMIDDIKPILEKIEFLLNKMDDAIYTNSLNPLPLAIGQQIEGTISADTVGYVLNLEDGADFKYAIANLDHQSIKMLYDALLQQLMMVGSVPSHVMGNSNIANVSEVSLKLLYQLATNKAGQLEIFIRDGLDQRFDTINALLEKQGIRFNDTDYIDVEFNYSKPVNTAELLDNLKKQYEMEAISKQTIIEKSELTNDVKQEMERLGLNKEK